MADEETPRAIKTVENPAMKAAAFVIVRCLILFRSEPTVRSLKEIPVIKETYEGRRGRTQGERKDNIPARKARVKEMSFMKVF